MIASLFMFATSIAPGLAAGSTPPLPPAHGWDDSASAPHALRVRLGLVEVDADPRADQVRRMIRQRQVHAGYCAERLVEQGDLVPTTTLLRFRVSPDGMVNQVLIEEDGPDVPMLICMAPLVARWQFPAGEAPIDVSVHYRLSATDMPVTFCWDDCGEAEEGG